MGNDLGKFVTDFSALVALAKEQAAAAPGGHRFLAELKQHPGVPAETLSVVTELIAARRLVDADILMAEMAAPDPHSRLLGMGGDQRGHAPLSDIIQQALNYANFPLSRPDYSNVSIDPRNNARWCHGDCGCAVLTANPWLCCSAPRIRTMGAGTPRWKFLQRIRTRPPHSWPDCARAWKRAVFSRAGSSP